MKFLKLDDKQDLDVNGVRMHIKKLQLKYHPDKMGGDRTIFEHIHSAGMVILKAISKQGGDHRDLKSSFEKNVSDHHNQSLSKSELAQNERIIQQAWDELVKKKDTELLRRKGYADKVDEDFSSSNTSKQLICRIEPDPIWFGIEDIDFEELNGDTHIKKPICHLNSSVGVDYHDAYNVDNKIDKIKPIRSETTWKDKNKYEHERETAVASELTNDEKIKRKQFEQELEQIESMRIEAQRKKDIYNKKIYDQINNLLTYK